MKNCSVFLDLARVFNTVKNDVLKQKMESHGRKVQALKLIRAFYHHEINWPK